MDCTLLTLSLNCLQLPPLSLSLSLSLSLTFSVYPLSCFLSLSLSLFFFSLSLSANSSPLSLTYKVINSPGLKLRYNQGFVIDKANTSPKKTTTFYTHNYKHIPLFQIFVTVCLSKKKKKQFQYRYNKTKSTSS